MPSIPIDDEMADLIAYLMKRGGGDAGEAVREALRDAADLERRIELDETHPAIQRVLAAEPVSFVPDPETLTRLRYLSKRLGREPEHVLREAIGIAYDIELQDHGGEFAPIMQP